MSSLTEQERMGLEDVFLSISSSRNIFQKWSSLGQNISFLTKVKKLATPFILSQKSNFLIKNPLKKHKITKLFNKMQKRRKI